MTFLQILRIIFGSIYVLFLPGFILTFVFFTKKEIDKLERFVLSLALSIAVVPFVVFLFSLVNVKINALNILWEIGLILVLSYAWILFEKSDYYSHLIKKLKFNKK